MFKKKIQWLLSKPHVVFAILFTIVGLWLIVAIPPYRGPDEAAHVFRIYQLSLGDLFTEYRDGEYGIDIPDSIMNVNIKGFTDKSPSIVEKVGALYDSGRPTQTSHFRGFAGSGIYSPIAYANYIPGMFIARVFTENGYLIYMFTKIFGFLVTALLIFLAIRVIPFGKWLFVAIGLMPMVVHQSTVISPDGLLISSVMLFVSLVLYLRFNYQILSKAYRIGCLLLLALLTVVIAAKAGYFTIIGTIFLLPTKMFHSKRTYVFVIASVFGVAIISMAVWYAAIFSIGQTKVMSSFFEGTNHAPLQPKKEILKNVAQNPLTVANKLFSTFVAHPRVVSTPYPDAPKFGQNTQPSFIFDDFTGKFGSLEVAPPSWLSVTVIATIVIGYGISSGVPKKYTIPRRMKFLTLFFMLSGCFAIFIIFWSNWTAAYMPFVFGIQGRYFIPFMPLLVLLLARFKIFNIRDIALIKSLLILLCINMFVSLLSIYHYFYA